MIMKHLLIALAAVTAAPAFAETDIVATDAYRWHGDTITQGEYMAYSPDGLSLISTYSAQPG